MAHDVISRAQGYVWDVSTLAWVRGQQPILNAGTVTADLTGTGLAKDSTLTAKYTTMTDYSGGDNLIYCGLAVTGSSTAAAVWQIRKFTYDGNSKPASIVFASGSLNYSYVWDNRAGYTYS